MTAVAEGKTTKEAADMAKEMRDAAIKSVQAGSFGQKSAEAPKAGEYVAPAINPFATKK